jgi:DNA invertase Pin-like site-specific DNA recombinase
MPVRVGYARTSTTQEDQDKSIEGQVIQLEAAGCERVIAERRSAFKGIRPGWDELWALVGRGEVAEVLVVDQSRLSRSGDDLQFLELCATKGTKVLTIIGGELELETDAGFLTANMMSVMNKLQSRITAAKVRDGLRRRRAAGHYACGKLPFGYTLIDSRPVPHPQHFEEARVMWLQLLEREMNVSGWIRDTGMPWTPRGVRKWFSNPMLRGAVRGQWSQVEPVISWAEWERAQAMLKVRSVIRGQAAHRVHLFTGLVQCEACGKSLHNVVEQGRRRRLKCMARHCPRYGQGLRVSVVREQVIAALVSRHAQMAELAAMTTPVETPEQARIRTEIATLEQVAHLPGVAALIEQQKAQLAAMTEQPTGPRLELLSELFADRGTLDLAADDELRPVVIEFVKSIVWLGGLESLAITLR